MASTKGDKSCPMHVYIYYKDKKIEALKAFEICHELCHNTDNESQTTGTALYWLQTLTTSIYAH